MSDGRKEKLANFKESLSLEQCIRADAVKELKSADAGQPGGIVEETAGL